MGASICRWQTNALGANANAHAHEAVLGESENSKLTDPFGRSGTAPRTTQSNAGAGQAAISPSGMMMLAPLL
jgi:hypothetical protein